MRFERAWSFENETPDHLVWEGRVTITVPTNMGCRRRKSENFFALLLATIYIVM